MAPKPSRRRCMDCKRWMKRTKLYERQLPYAPGWEGEWFCEWCGFLSCYEVRSDGSLAGGWGHRTNRGVCYKRTDWPAIVTCPYCGSEYEGKKCQHEPQIQYNCPSGSFRCPTGWLKLWQDENRTLTDQDIYWSGRIDGCRRGDDPQPSSKVAA